MENNTEEYLSNLLPEYLTGNLDSQKSKDVEAWLEDNDQAMSELNNWVTIRDAVKSQALKTPSQDIWSKLANMINNHSNPKDTPLQPSLSWGLGSAIAIFVMLIMWLTVRPGIVLEWSIDGGTPDVYRIFRAGLGSEDYQLIKEVDSQPGKESYQFYDIYIVPGRAYSYRVEGIGSAGSLAITQSIISNPMAALPGQIAIVFISILVAFITILAVNTWAPLLNFHSRATSSI